MFYALNAYRVLQNGQISDDGIISRVKGTSVREAFDFISKNLEDMMPALEHIAAVDYSFDKPEWIDPELFIEDYIKRNENGWLNFKPIMMWEKGHNQAPEDIWEPFSGEIVLSKGNSIYQFLFPKDALEHVFKNIISNAQAHGFDKKTRDDYQLRFSWHMEGLALIVEIDNNGSPIPNDRDTASLLEYGVSTALHQDGHNGIGCNEIDDIMQRYDGNVEIVSSPENEFPVKYILKFNRSNIIESI
jgi:signal transduction histidine kinase